MMDLKKSLTPPATEEIKPGLFVQKKGDSYRVVNPIVWNNEWRLNKQFGWKNLVTILIISFLAYSYFSETSFSRSLQEDPCSLLQNISSFCSEKIIVNPLEKNILETSEGVFVKIEDVNKKEAELFVRDSDGEGFVSKGIRSIKFNNE